MKKAVLLAICLSAGLAAPAFAQNLGLRQAPADEFTARADRSVVGLYLAGSAALSDGRYPEAADFFARAGALSEGEAREMMMEQAFGASVLAGDIERAALLAPSAGSTGGQRLGAFVTAIDSFARNDTATASALLDGEGIGAPYTNAARMIEPWVMVAAGDGATLQPQVAPRRDALSQVFAVYNQAMVMEALGRNADADKLYLEAVSRGVGLLDFQFGYAEFLERQGKRNLALQVYDSILELNPAEVRAQEGRERVRRRRGDPPALFTPQQGAAQSLMSAGTMAFAQSSYETAMAYFWLARRLDPTRTDATFLAATIEAGLGNQDSAIRHFSSIPQDAPEFLSARVGIAETLLSQDNIDGAVATARETLTFAPDEDLTRTSLAGILAMAEDHAEAVRLLDGVIRDNRRDPQWELLFQRAISLQEIGQWPRAEQDLINALDLEPNQPDVMNFLGYTWADRGENLDQALEMLQRAARAEPRAGHIIDSLGWAYYRLGQVDLAVENLERAVELSPASPDINDHLGDAYLAAGRRLEAEFQWERVLSLDPEPELQARVEAKLASQRGVPSTVARSVIETTTP
jgi:tetratricopeptide (TPR) repeat protein